MLYINFIWHMHQPCYVNPVNRKTFFPWVWVHAVHDYYPMAQILRRYPSVKVTFNLVPSLLEQLRYYADGVVRDFFWDFCHRYPDVKEEEKTLFLKLCFSIDEDRMIKPYSHFDSIRSRFYDGEELSEKDVIDAAVWFVLSWLSYEVKREDDYVVGLIKKGKGFSKDDLLYLENLVIRFVSKTLNLYRELHRKGQVEISTTPFYHPILPLIIDTDIMSVCMPDAPAPFPPFSFREDAVAQVKMAVEYYASTFGKRPAGMWPAEGAVSEEAVKIMGEEGIKWIATDEGILEKTLLREGKEFYRSCIYKPYRFGNVSVFFRDRELSDLIGFTYSRWESSKEAVEDFIEHLKAISDRLGKTEGFVVTVALDGENPWEYYPNGGYDFLDNLYERLSSISDMQTILPSEYLERFGCKENLSSLYPGSWINADFSTWIGETEKNRAWQLLASTRDFLRVTGKKIPSDAWRFLYVAEGSDWFWWFGETHFTPWYEEFDALFRSNLIAVYRSVGIEPSSELFLPVKLKNTDLMKKPVSFIYPLINGKIDGYMEWLGSGEFDVRNEVSSMVFGYRYVVKIKIGFNIEKMFVLLKGGMPYRELKVEAEVKLYFMCGDKRYFLSIPLKACSGKRLLYKCNKSCDVAVGDVDVSVDSVVEAAVDWQLMGVSAGERIEIVALVVDHRGRLLERLPRSGVIGVEVPTEDFEERNWMV